jgi:hypothetical protein
MTKKLKELGPDVNADPEILPSSGKLYHRAGERAAKQYIPVRTHNGESLILAAQGAKDYDKMRKIGKPYVDGFFRTPNAAKKALYKVFMDNGESDPSAAFYTKIVHLNPTDSGALPGSTSSDMERESDREDGEEVEESERRPSGLTHAIDAVVALGKSDGQRAVPLLRKQIASYGKSASISDRAVRRAVMSHISRLSTEGADKLHLRGRDRDEYTQAFEARAIYRLLDSSASGAARPERGGDEEDRRGLEQLAESLRSYALNFSGGSARDRWAADSVRQFASFELPLRLARGQIELAKKQASNLPADFDRIGAFQVANDVRKILARVGVHASGELSKGVRTGILVAGVGAAIVGVTMIAQHVAKSQASRRA